MATNHHHHHHHLRHHRIANAYASPPDLLHWSYGAHVPWRSRSQLRSQSHLHAISSTMELIGFSPSTSQPLDVAITVENNLRSSSINGLNHARNALFKRYLHPLECFVGMNANTLQDTTSLKTNSHQSTSENLIIDKISVWKCL